MNSKITGGLCRRNTHFNIKDCSNLIGMNCGLAAGQSVWHCHVHLIPRRKGDSKYPKGGVRHVIPDYEDLR